MNQTINQSINQTMNQSINQTMNQSIKQLTFSVAIEDDHQDHVTSRGL
jgi:hypothetical protein